MVHSQWRLILDKEKAFATAIDKRKRLMRDKVLILNNESQKYAFLISRTPCVVPSKQTSPASCPALSLLQDICMYLTRQFCLSFDLCTTRC
jgi:hypothetical protein